MAERWSLAPARLLTVSQHVEAYIVRPVDFATKRAETPSVLACGGRARRHEGQGHGERQGHAGPVLAAMYSACQL